MFIGRPIKISVKYDSLKVTYLLYLKKKKSTYNIPRTVIALLITQKLNHHVRGRRTSIKVRTYMTAVLYIE